MKKILYGAVRVLPFLLLLAFTFFASGQNASQSASLSGKVTERVLDVVEPGFSELPQPQRAEKISRWDGEVREWAHGLLFLLLGLAAALALGVFPGLGNNLPPRVFAAYWAVFLIAVLDETHQLFSEGRAFEVLDLFIDWGGGGLGCMVMGGLLYLNGRARARRANQ